MEIQRFACGCELLVDSSGRLDWSLCLKHERDFSDDDLVEDEDVAADYQFLAWENASVGPTLYGSLGLESLGRLSDRF